MDEGSLIKVKNVSLPKATFVKFRAQSVDFLEVSNPRALLEVALRKYTCLTLGDTICIPYDKNKKFYLDVMEVQPNGAASIIETDCNVDFDEPLGYKDSKYAQYEKNKEGSTGNNSVDSSVNGKAEKKVIDRPLQKATIVSEEDSNTNKFQAFSGAAKRIDGKVSGKAEAKDSFSSGSSAKAGADTGSSAKASSAKADSAEISKEIPAAPVHQSRIGSKFSKKKAAVSAFGGPAHKLNG